MSSRPNGQTHAGTFKQDPKEICQTITAWRKTYPGATFAVAIEATKGALINALIAYDDVVIYPINPAALASYRKAFGMAAARTIQPMRCCWPSTSTTTRTKCGPCVGMIRSPGNSPLLSRDRRRLVDQRVDFANELSAMLKQYYPAVLQFEAAKPYAEFLLRFVIKYPTLAERKQPARLA